MSTTECERCFSTVKRIKTFLRSIILENRLKAFVVMRYDRRKDQALTPFNWCGMNWMEGPAKLLLRPQQISVGLTKTMDQYPSYSVEKMNISDVRNECSSCPSYETSVTYAIPSQ